MTEAGATAAHGRSGHGDATTYELFIGVLTILAFINMAFLLLIDLGPVRDILFGTDTLLCLLFFLDFTRSLRLAPNRAAYLFPYGVLDLLGSVPGSGPLRLLRVFRLRRISRELGGRRPQALARDFLSRRAEAALYIVIVLSIVVLDVGSSLVVVAEQTDPTSNIKTGGDAFWWAFVTITTVGYGDRFPVTGIGRVVAMLTMAIGIGIFGVLTTFLSSTFLAPRKSPDAPPAPDEPGGAVGPVGPASADIAAELAALRREISELRESLDSRDPGRPA